MYIVKRFLLFGVLPLALTGAGCATAGHGDTPKAAAVTPASQTPIPGANALGTPGPEVNVFLAQAQQARKTGDTATAIKLLSQLVLVAPDDPRVLGEYGKALAAGGRSDDAVAFLDRAIQLEPRNWTFYSAQGVAYDQQGKFKSAQLSYARALELKPGEVVVLNNDALSHIQSGDYDGAQHLLAQVSPGSPDYAQIGKSLALLEKMKPAPAATSAAPLRQVASDETKPQPQQAAVDPPPTTATKQPVLVTPPPAMPAPLTAPPSTQAIAPYEVRPTIRETPKPQVAALPPPRTALERLRADPTVVMQRLPTEHTEVAGVETRPAKTAVARAQPRVAAAQPEGDVRYLLGKDGAPHSVVKDGAPHSVVVAQAENDVHPAADAPVSGPQFYVQAGSFLSNARARQAAIGLESLDVKIMTGTVNGREVFRLRIGPFASRTDAQKKFGQAKALGRSDLIIVRD